MGKILIFLAGLIGFHFVPENHRAAVVRLGMYNRAVGPGFIWIVPLVERVENLVRLGMRFTVFTVEQVVSSDSIPFDFELTVRYRFDPDLPRRPIAARMVRLPDHVLESIVKDYVDKSLHRTVAQYSSEDIFKRSVVADIEKGVIEGLKAQGKHLGLAPMADSGIVIRKITPPQDFLESILAAKRYELILRVLTAYQAADVDQALLAEFVSAFKDASPELVSSLTELLKPSSSLETVPIDNGKMVVKRRWRQSEDPYVVGPPIESPEAFYGRQEILADLLQALRAGNHVAIYGERRIGKTSLLHQLAHYLWEMGDTGAYLYLPVFLNLQMVPEARFFYALMRAIAGVVRPYLHDRGQTLPSLLADERSAGYDSLDMADDLERVLESLHEVTDRPVRVVLLLDEADKMNGYDPHTQEGLRGLLMTPLGRQVKLVWSGQTMNREWYLETSPWFNLFKHEIHLVGLEEEAAVRLIRQPVKGVFTYDDEAVARILHYSDRQPYTIQRLCSFCVRQLLAKDRFRVTVEDVETAYRAMQDKDARRAAEGVAPQAVYAPQAPVQSLAEDQGEYKADESRPDEEE